MEDGIMSTLSYFFSWTVSGTSSLSFSAKGKEALSSVHTDAYRSRTV